MPTFSIIIPHKNCPELLKRCLQSIPIREDIETIVVDDNSTDIGPIKQLEGETAERNILFVLTTDGKGAGFARNVGLTYAKGEWIIFADADDFFDEQAFDVFDKYADSDNDIVYFPHRSVYSDTLESCNRFNVRNQVIEAWQKKGSEKRLNRIKYYDLVPWSKMFRKDYVDRQAIKFDEVPASNDVMFVVQTAANTQNICVSSEIVYVLTYRKGSITRVADKRNNFSRYMVSLRYNNYMDMIGNPEMKKRVASYILLAWRSFGKEEALLYMREAHAHKQGIFTGIMPKGNEISDKLASLFHKNNYQG